MQGLASAPFEAESAISEGGESRAPQAKRMVEQEGCEAVAVVAGDAVSSLPCVCT
jgi:hypothetical protein